MIYKTRVLANFAFPWSLELKALIDANSFQPVWSNRTLPVR